MSLETLEVLDKPMEKSQVSSSAGFRKAFWGMTKDQVSHFFFPFRLLIPGRAEIVPVH
jgi:hypothetical protein